MGPPTFYYKYAENPGRVTVLFDYAKGGPFSGAATRLIHLREWELPGVKPGLCVSAKPPRVSPSVGVLPEQLSQYDIQAEWDDLITKLQELNRNNASGVKHVWTEMFQKFNDKGVQLAFINDTGYYTFTKPGLTLAHGAWSDKFIVLGVSLTATMETTGELGAQMMPDAAGEVHAQVMEAPGGAVPGGYSAVVNVQGAQGEVHAQVMEAPGGAVPGGYSAVMNAQVF